MYTNLPMRRTFLLFLFSFIATLGYSQSIQEHRWVQKMEQWYAQGDYDKLMDRAEKWRKRNRPNRPPSWVFSYYKSKGYFGMAATETGRRRASYLKKGMGLLRQVNKRDREGQWQGLDEAFTAQSRATLAHEGQLLLQAGNPTGASSYYRVLAEVYHDTTRTYRLLEDRAVIRDYPISRRSSQEEVIAWYILEQVNELRKTGCECGGEWMPPVPPVAWDSTLAETGRLHSTDMHDQEYFDHTGRDGSKPWDRAGRLGYRSSSMGENIAHGYHNEAAVFRGWRYSPGHCKNMMAAGFKDMGVGRYDDYWTMVLGSKEVGSGTHR